MDKSRESFNLDFLRASAVTLVLIAHLCIFFGYADRSVLNPRGLGILGVLFFFVHTSLVLMFSLQRQERKSGSRGLFLAFIVRRVFRIYPLSLTILAVICVFRLPSGYLKYHSLSFVPPDTIQLVSNALLAQNLVNKVSILGVMWSLPFEMQMYVFLPLLFVFASKIRTVWPLMMLWVGAAVLAFVQAQVGHLPDFFQYVPCFVPGIIAFNITSRVRPRVPFLVMPFMLVALALVYVYNYSEGPAGVLRGMFVCLGIGLTLPHFIEVASLPVRTVSHLIAKYSYGIYLVHYFCMWTAFHTLGFLPAVLQWVAFAALMCGIPALLFHTIESPMIRVGNKVATRLFHPQPAQPQPEPATVP